MEMYLRFLMSSHMEKQVVLVFRLLVTYGTLELRLDTTLESNVPVQGVRPRVSVSTTRARVAGSIANIRVISCQRWLV